MYLSQINEQNDKELSQWVIQQGQTNEYDKPTVGTTNFLCVSV